MRPDFPQIRRLPDLDALRGRLDELGLELPLAEPDDVAGALSGTCGTARHSVPNRFAVLPMEGWDATGDGRPTELLRRRWRRFGASGAGLIWGGEAVAVVPEGRANPHQLCIGPHSAADLASLRADLMAAARSTGTTPVVGLQLTHSGRWARPDGSPAPAVAYRHPLLDRRVGATDAHVLSDTELDDLVEAFVAAALIAQQAGFDFVDVKHCHGYLLHELLSAHDRPGPRGGSFDGRTSFLRDVLDGIARDAPGLEVGVRLSLFDVSPHHAGDDGTGEPEATGEYPYAFGGDGTGAGIDLAEPSRLVGLLEGLGVRMVCVSAGSPYTCPHVQRPAFFPPSDGYGPPNDPLVDVVRMQSATAQLRRRHPDTVFVASGLTYLQDHLPAAAAGLVRDGWADVIGFGRMALSMPSLPRRVLSGEELDRRSICRTFSDCTTAPRNGLVSGCWPLDEHYRSMPERAELAAVKRAASTSSRPPRSTARPEDRD